MHVPSDIPVDGYISRIKTPKTRLSGQNMQVDLRKQNGAQPEENQAMIFNFTNKFQFTSRTQINGQVLDVIRETKLLGVMVNDKLSWDSSTSYLLA